MVFDTIPSGYVGCCWLLLLVRAQLYSMIDRLSPSFVMRMEWPSRGGGRVQLLKHENTMRSGGERE